MKIIAFANLKGGSGKTANSFNIAGILAEKKKVLLLDIDPQCNLTSNAGVDTADTSILTTNEIFINFVHKEKQPRIEDLIIKAPVEGLPKLDLIPSSMKLFGTEEDLYKHDGKTKILKFYLQNHWDVLKKYDYIIMDTNPSMSVFNQNAFSIADSIILSSDISKNARDGAMMFCSLWDEKRARLNATAETPIDDNIDGLVVCAFDGRNKVSFELVEYYHNSKFFENLVFNTVIPISTKIKDTEIEGKPVNLIAPRTKITQAFRNLADEMKKRRIL